MIITPGRGDRSLIDMIKELLVQEDLHDTQLIIGLSSEFKHSAFVSIFSLADDLVASNAPSVRLLLTRSFHSLKISAAASIIIMMKKSDHVVSLPDQIEWFSMGSYMHIDQDSLIALQIVCEEQHPNMHFEKRDGLSLLGIMNQCKSTSGKHLFRQWMLHPLNDLEKIKERLEKVSWMLENIIGKGMIGEIQALLRGLSRLNVIRLSIALIVSS